MRAVYPILAILASACLLTAGCGGGTDAAPDPSPAAAAPSGEAETRAAREGPLVVFLGDSLTAGHGLAQEQAFPALLERKLIDSGMPVRVVNAGVSGDTTAGGLSRLSWLLNQKPDVVVVGLGANDAMRGQPLENVEANLREIVERARASGAKVLLLGMRIPTNFGPDYSEGFAGIYPRVAKSLGVELVPFLLDGVGGHADLNLADGIHPNERGQEIVADNVFRHLRRVVKAVR